MAKAKHLETVKIRKPLPIYGGEILPAGSDISVTEEWEPLPYGGRARVVLDSHGDRRLVVEQDLEYALGAH
jgi:hypothetical protein